jgi:hypothetical protein
MGTVTKVKIPYKPRDCQRDMHTGMENNRFSVIVAHRRCGKSVAVINHLIKQACINTTKDSRYGYLAPQYRQAKAIMWSYLLHYTAPIPGTKKNESELWVELPNKARIQLFGADNPDSLRGLYWDGVALDEVAQMKPDVWGEVVRPALTDRGGSAVFIGTPKGVNLFYELYQTALRNDSWYAGMFRADETGVIPEEELMSAKSLMSDNQYRQEFLCDFQAASDDVLIPIDLVEEASQRILLPEALKGAPIVIGVDVARFGDDSSCIVVRQGTAVLKVKTLKDVDTMMLSELVAQEVNLRKAKATFVDVVGIGAGVVDRLRQLGYRIIAVNAGESPTDISRFSNKRAEMWVRMRDWLTEGGVIPNDQRLKADLVSVKFDWDNNSKLKLERKEVMKARGIPSPDCGDALALTFAQHISPGYVRDVAGEERTTDDSPLFWKK